MKLKIEVDLSTQEVQALIDGCMEVWPPPFHHALRQATQELMAVE